MLGLVPDGGKNGGDNDTDYNDNISYSTAWDFIKKLTTTGTRFKFSSDPESVEYTVLSSVVPQAYASSIYDMNLNGWGDSNYWKDGSNKTDGHWGIRNFSSNSGSGSNQNVQWRGSNLRQRWSIMVTPEIGSGNASASGYNPVAGTLPPRQTSPCRSTRCTYQACGTCNKHKYIFPKICGCLSKSSNVESAFKVKLLH